MEKTFEKVFEVAEIAKFSRDELMSYEDSLKYYRDLKNSLETAKIEAVEKRDVEIVINSNKTGLDNQTISLITGLTIEQIEEILRK